jgi:hypothetical protein
LLTKKGINSVYLVCIIQDQRLEMLAHSTHRNEMS